VLTFQGGTKVFARAWVSTMDDIEPGCLEQLAHLADLPFAFHHIAVMPDCHQGYGMPIGGVLAAKGVVICNAVGVDIGCGVCAVKLNLPVEQVKPVLHDLLNDIQRSVPTGFNWHHAPTAEAEAFFASRDTQGILILEAERENAKRQLGTLGGGNHFIELQADQDGQVWLMLHSGSRNLGKKVCDHYNEVAEDLNARWFSSVPKEWELAFLPLDSPEGREYMAAMEFCVAFAEANRRAMVNRVSVEIWRRFPKAELGEAIDVNHNYARLEHHFGQNVVIHRKGAVHAPAGATVVIPGSMGSSSYIGRGLGNSESFLSCSHGAGRRMGRKEATRQFTAESVILDMRAQGIELLKVKKDDVAEECAGAYKDIEWVMAQEADLVEPVVKLRPIGVVKG